MWNWLLLCYKSDQLVRVLRVGTSVQLTLRACAESFLPVYSELDGLIWINTYFMDSPGFTLLKTVLEPESHHLK